MSGPVCNPKNQSCVAPVLDTPAPTFADYMSMPKKATPQPYQE